jgi:hypothetical protein
MVYENFSNNAANKNWVISDNYIEGANAQALKISGDNIVIQDNLVVDCGKNGVFPVRLVHLKNSSFKGNTIKNRPPFGRYAAIEEMGINTNNTIEDNIIENTNTSNAGNNNIFHAASSTVTNSRYINNKLTSIGGDGIIVESANSNNNIYDNNLTGVLNAAVPADNKGIFKVGTASKIISHKQTDGRVFIPNLTQSNP